MNNHKYLIMIAIVLVVIAQLACGGENAGQKVSTSSASAVTSAPKIEVYKVGDVIAVKDQTIVLNSAEIKNSRLVANFTIENKGTGDIAVSSILSFSAKADDGAKLDQDIFDCGSSLDGTIIAGDKLKGNICWKGLTTDKAKIYYEANIFSTGAIVWEITK